jgi:hypothetical protein
VQQHIVVTISLASDDPLNPDRTEIVVERTHYGMSVADVDAAVAEAGRRARAVVESSERVWPTARQS